MQNLNVQGIEQVVPERLASGLPANSALNEEQRRSQVSGGHRLLRLVRQKGFQLYSRDEFHTRAVYSSADYWLDSFVPALRGRMSEMIARRVNAAVARARTQRQAYGVCKPGVAEYVTEAFFDNTWFKISEQNLSRSELRDRVQRQIERGQQLELLFPIFSRKPFSPIKNRGFNPDLGEVHSLARCVEAAHVIDTLCPTGCRLTILADGFKYNRACRTPDDIVAIYQSGLRFWADQLDVADVVNVVNYEEWIRENLTPAYLSARTPLYLDHCCRLTARYSRLFDAADLTHSLAAVEEVDDVGQQLAFTFWSIITSTYYTELFDFVAKRSFIDRHYGDDTQRLYLAYAASLHRLLDRSSSDRSSSGRGSALPLGYLHPSCFAYLFHRMRCEAWEATIRYVAISLTDRELNVLNQISRNAIKLTIHAKKGELHFLSATHQDAAMTAQHSTGGLAATDGAAKMTFRYRLERESDRERPVLIESLPDTPHHRATYGPLWQMQKIGQPIAYVADPAVLRDWRIHNMLTRKG